MPTQEEPQVVATEEPRFSPRTMWWIRFACRAFIITTIVAALVASIAQHVSESSAPVPVKSSAGYLPGVVDDPQEPGQLKCEHEDLARIPDRLVYNPHTEQYTVNFYGEALVPEALIIGSYRVNPDDPSHQPAANPDQVIVITPELRESAANEGLLLDVNRITGSSASIVKMTVCRMAP